MLFPTRHCSEKCAKVSRNVHFNKFAPIHCVQCWQDKRCHPSNQQRCRLKLKRYNNVFITKVYGYQKLNNVREIMWTTTDAWATSTAWPVKRFWKLWPTFFILALVLDGLEAFLFHYFFLHALLLHLLLLLLLLHVALHTDTRNSRNTSTLTPPHSLSYLTGTKIYDAKIKMKQEQMFTSNACHQHIPGEIGTCEVDWKYKAKRSLLPRGNFKEFSYTVSKVQSMSQFVPRSANDNILTDFVWD